MLFLFYSSPNPNEIEKTLNLELNVILKWVQENWLEVYLLKETH